MGIDLNDPEYANILGISGVSLLNGTENNVYSEASTIFGYSIMSLYTRIFNMTFNEQLLINDVNKRTRDNTSESGMKSLIDGAEDWFDNQSRDSKMDKIVIQLFNAKFEPYLNKRSSGTNTKALIDAVNSNNSSNEHKVSIVDENGNDLSNARGSISAALKYDIETSKTSPEGYIQEIKVTKLD